MKIIQVFFIGLSFYCLPAIGQVTVDTTIRLDLLKSPASPAFNILGIAQSDIERPADLTAFALSIQNATNNFTSIPESYAFQIAPFLMGRKKYSLNQFDNNQHTFKQSFQFSAGYTHIGPKGKEDVDSLKTTKLGLGIKFSIIRPRWTADTRNKYTVLRQAQVQLIADRRAYEEKHPQYSLLKEKKQRLQLLEMKDSLNEVQLKEFNQLIRDIRELEENIGEDYDDVLPDGAAFAAARKAATAFKTERAGFFLDFSGGMALDFPDNRFNNSNVYRAGMWLTGGNENGNKGISSLFILRYLYNPTTLFAAPSGLLKGGKLSTFDMGGRFLLDVSREKFVLSAEALYRSILGSSTVDPSWRLVINAEYDLGTNRKLTFAFGRDFDGTISKGGNLVAMINLIAGFGGDRKIAD